MNKNIMQRYDHIQGKTHHMNVTEISICKIDTNRFIMRGTYTNVYNIFATFHTPRLIFTGQYDLL